MLSDNDWSRLDRALRELREDRVEVTMGRTSIEVQTARAGRGWTVSFFPSRESVGLAEILMND